MFKRFSYTIFKKEYSDLFTIYGYGIDTIQHILHSLGYKYDKISDEHARDECIYVLKKLLEYDIIQVNHWGKYHEIVNELDLDIRQTILYIKGVWFIGADYMDFEEMITFSYKEWYLEKMTKEGIDVNTNWDWFAEEFVPNLENWIKENKLKGI